MDPISIVLALFFSPFINKDPPKSTDIESLVLRVVPGLLIPLLLRVILRDHIYDNNSSIT